jgi:7-cyano-7-deazaguanine synthase
MSEGQQEKGLPPSASRLPPSQWPLAVVMLSGGMDSLVAAGLAVQVGFELALIHFNYGQRTEEAELRAFRRIAEYFGVPAERRLVAHTNFFAIAGGSALTTGSIAVPAADLSSKTIPITYVPFRNAVLLSMAVGWAEVLGARAVYYGAVSADSSGYPDCRASFVEAFNRLVDQGTRPESAIEVRAPLVDMTKADIVRLASKMGLPLGMTWSCYSRNDLACGACDSCALRLRGFKEAGLEDPLPYARPAAQEAALRLEKARRLRALLHALTVGK